MELIPHANMQNARSVTDRLVAPRTDYAMSLAVRQLASAQADKPKYLLEPEITVLLAVGFTDLRQRMFFDTLWNTGARLNEALGLVPADIRLDLRWPERPKLRLMNLKQRGKAGRPPTDTVRDVPLMDESFVLRMRDHLATFHKNRTHRLWTVTDDTARHWLRDAVTECERHGFTFSVPVTPHTFRHSFAMHLLNCGIAPLTLQALLGHRDYKSTQVYLRTLALEANINGQYGVRFGMDLNQAAALVNSNTSR